MPFKLPQNLIDDINTQLEYCEHSLADWISSCSDLKMLRDNATFEGGKVFDYSMLGVSCFYIMKYYGAYIVEYFHIYSSIVRQAATKRLNVVSVGYGSGVDLRALYFLYLNGDVESLVYRGYDLCEWPVNVMDGIDSSPQFQFDPLLYDACKINVFNGEEDCIVFAKSIGEMSEEDLKSLRENINITAWRGEKKYIAVSLRFETIEIDKHVAYSIAKCFPGYEIVTNYYFNGGNYARNNFGNYDAGIGRMFSGYSIPGSCESFLKNIFKLCNKYKRNSRHCADTCDSGLRVIPIYTLKYINFVIYELESRA